jgi:SNF2 family DNA or RNA helicase
MQTEFYHDSKRNLLVYKTEDPARIVNSIAEARQINGHHVAVPRSLYNCQLLRWLNLPVTPIMDTYDWPHRPGITPLRHQKLMSNFVALHPRCFNLSDMGTMKTLATLWAADWVMQQYPKGTCRAVIVAPLTILKSVWADAIFSNFLKRRTFAIVHGSASKRLEALSRDVDFYIINFDGVGVGAHTRPKIRLDGFSQELANRSDIQICIVDEASAYRDSRTKRHRLARFIIGARPYLWFLTGTPTPNYPTDAYGLAKIVNNAFGMSFGTFQSRSMIRINQFKLVPARDGYEQARALLQPAIRFDIKDVWNGPALTTQQREVPLTKDQHRLMADLKRDLVIKVKSGATIDAVNEAAIRTKFIQLSLGAVYDADHKWHAVDSEPRLAELEAVLEQANGKAIIFVPLTSVVNMLNIRLSKKYTTAVINGPVKANERAEIFKAFQREQHPRILIADPGCVAHGVDLFNAQTVIWYGPTDKTELYLQGNKRAHRPGQKHPVTIVQLVSNKLEREIFGRLERNESMQGLLLQMVKEDRL